MPFDISDFRKNSITKFYYDKGRHSATSLVSYRGELYVHKFLGNEYRGVTEVEYQKMVSLMEKLYEFLKTRTEINLSETAYLGYNSDNNCIERIEKHSGISLRDVFPSVGQKERLRISEIILDQIDSLVRANNEKIELVYTIDPTPDNFTYGSDGICFIDFMPPLIRDKSIDPHVISDKSRTGVDLSVQTFRYFNQKGLYLTFLTKFGALDITFFRELFSLTLGKIRSNEVRDFLYRRYQTYRKVNQRKSLLPRIRIKNSRSIKVIWKNPERHVEVDGCLFHRRFAKNCI